LVTTASPRLVVLFASLGVGAAGKEIWKSHPSGWKTTGSALAFMAQSDRAKSETASRRIVFPFDKSAPIKRQMACKPGSVLAPFLRTKPVVTIPLGCELPHTSRDRPGRRSEKDHLPSLFGLA